MSGAIVPLIAAAVKKRREREEEDMSRYSNADLEGWEFKIVHSAFGKFSNPGAIRELCEQEAKAGWEMLEKFDNYRIRFKRRIEKRSMDQFLENDPYRIETRTAGVSVMLILGVTLLIAGILITLILANH
ncbi:MAG: hypothetical protein PHU88_11550 [candidate division Zixibacteria bacterium]|nr:hypothetical protein [candidate division Zixibacteria bacterium]MDD5425581.1 hypothetical protein [candidate division Zixibacteria bacterium]